MSGASRPGEKRIPDTGVKNQNALQDDIAWTVSRMQQLGSDIFLITNSKSILAPGL
jgi:hypothetical protein